MENQVKEKIVAAIEEIIGKELTVEENLIDGGTLDSILTMQLVSQLEQEFGIMFEMDELTMYNLNSLKTLTELVEKKAAA